MTVPIMFHVKAQADRDARSAAAIARLFYVRPGAHAAAAGLNAYFRMGHDAGGFRLWWRQLTGSDATLDNAHVMRLAGRFGRRIRGYAKANDIPVARHPWPDIVTCLSELGPINGALLAQDRGALPPYPGLPAAEDR
jgi:hypothetical protein